MKTPQKDPYGSVRLKSKNAKNAIIQKISQDFNLTPIIAEAYFRQISAYFNEHLSIKLSSGQIAYEAVAEDGNMTWDPVCPIKPRLSTSTSKGISSLKSNRKPTTPKHPCSNI